MALPVRFTTAASRRIGALPKAFSSPRFFSVTAINTAKISEAIKDDHRDLEQAYKNILSAISSDDKEKWRNKFTWELARHSISEELVVYPQFEKLLPDGKDMAQKDREEHSELLNQFRDMQPEHADFETILQDLWSQLSEHIKEEEHHDLVALEKSLDQAHSEKLVNSFNRTKMFAPTRSHPHAPNKPPFETVAGLIAAPIDRLRDIFRSFPEETKGQPPP